MRDVGLLPEAEIHARAGNSSPYEMGHDDRQYPIARVLAAAGVASGLKPNVTDELTKAMQDADSGVRYWGVMGILMRGAGEVAKSHAALVKALNDVSPSVRVAAAEALGRYGSEDDVQKALAVLIVLADPVANHSYVAMHALNAIDAMGKKASPLKDRLQALPRSDPNSPERVRTEYTTRMLEWLQTTL